MWLPCGEGRHPRPFQSWLQGVTLALGRDMGPAIFNKEAHALRWGLEKTQEWSDENWLCVFLSCGLVGLHIVPSYWLSVSPGSTFLGGPWAHL